MSEQVNGRDKPEKRLTGLYCYLLTYKKDAVTVLASSLAVAYALKLDQKKKYQSILLNLSGSVLLLKHYRLKNAARAFNKCMLKSGTARFISGKEAYGAGSRSDRR
ncbi:MAG: hypothetical protein Kow0029_02300 [Candidatus Rifleibacteriota bacterium]